MTWHGKKGTAPCGHPGTHVVGTYVQCDVGCDRVAGEGDESDGVPGHADPECTQPICPYLGCPGGPIKRWGDEFSHPVTGDPFWLCDGCGRSFHA